MASWWPSLVIGAGVVRWVRPPRSIGGGTLLVAVGTVLQLWRLEVIGDLSLLWPAILLTLGLWLVTVFGDADVDLTASTLESGARIDGVTVFGDVTVRRGLPAARPRAAAPTAAG